MLLPLVSVCPLLSLVGGWQAGEGQGLESGLLTGHHHDHATL